ncbi:UNKNOWN [Stylonychia lemnae]|uniref:Uncharacterized protein n=1 Tax=Stylonychia lemnae TaxID=5949 RepID=A0A078AHF8_STYLE|nr:UNKNOWN [Stylonychia lemnae]|eukprot:CDW80273.1 UNKNOWN [Stylonychia lemnae]
MQELPSSNYEKYLQILGQSSRHSTQNNSTELSFANTNIGNKKVSFLSQNQTPQQKQQIMQSISNQNIFHQNSPSLPSMTSIENTQQNSLQGDVKILQVQMSQLIYKIEKLEQESSQGQDRMNSLAKVCQLQQKFQEHWEEEQENLKKSIDEKINGIIKLNEEQRFGKKGDMTLVEELDNSYQDKVENSQYGKQIKLLNTDLNAKIDGIQDQINKLGEEIASDINQLEQSIKHIKSWQNIRSDSKKNSGTFQSSILQSFASLSQDPILTDTKILSFIKDQLQRLDDLKVNLDQFKILESKVVKNMRDIQSNKKTSNKLINAFKSLESRIEGITQRTARSFSVSTVGRSGQRSQDRSPSNYQKQRQETQQKQQNQKISQIQQDIEILKFQVCQLQQTIITGTLLEDISVIENQRDQSEDKNNQAKHQLISYTDHQDQEQQNDDDMETFEQTSQFNNQISKRKNRKQNSMKQININIKKEKQISQFRKIRGRAMSKENFKYEAQFLNDKSPTSQKSVTQSKKKEKSRVAQRNRDITPLKNINQNFNINSGSKSTKKFKDQSNVQSQQYNIQSEQSLKKSINRLNVKKSKRNIRERSASFDVNQVKKSRVTENIWDDSWTKETDQALKTNQSMYSDNKGTMKQKVHNKNVDANGSVIIHDQNQITTKSNKRIR